MTVQQTGRRRLQLRVDSRWHPSRAALHAVACPSATPASLGVRGYSGSAPLVYVSGQDNEISLYDLQDFKTRQRICGWRPQRPQEPGPRPDGLPAVDVSDAKAAKLPDLGRGGFRALLPLPSGGLICAGAVLVPAPFGLADLLHRSARGSGRQAVLIVTRPL